MVDRASCFQAKQSRLAKTHCKCLQNSDNIGGVQLHGCDGPD
jgi:hypothetical protein